MPQIAGIDFGTTNSALALAAPDGKLQIAKFQSDNHLATTFRCIIYFDDEEGRRPRIIAGSDAIFMTGGSSFVPAIKRLFRQKFGVDRRIRAGEEFTSVAQGLAISALEMFG